MILFMLIFAPKNAWHNSLLSSKILKANYFMVNENGNQLYYSYEILKPYVITISAIFFFINIYINVKDLQSLITANCQEQKTRKRCYTYLYILLHTFAILSYN